MALAGQPGTVGVLRALKGPGVLKVRRVQRVQMVRLGNYLPWGSTVVQLRAGQLGSFEGRQACWERFYRTKAHNLQSGDGSHSGCNKT